MKTSHSNMRKWCAGLALAGLLGSSGIASGQIVTFDFAGLAGNEATATNNAKDANLDDTVISRSPTMPSLASNGDRFNSTNWAVVSIANAVSGGKYMEFTITPKAGYQFDVSSIYVQWQRSGTGNRGVSLRSSADSYAADIGSEWALNDVTTTQNNTWTFSQGNSTAPVTYRLYSWAEAITGTGGPGDGSGNDIIVYGTVTATGGEPVAPSVTTVAASGIGTTAATANGNVTDDGGDTVTERGVCYKTSSGVALTDNKTAAAAGGEGEFSVDLASLSVNQIYYFKAYASNSVGETLSDTELDFTTLANVPAAPTVDNPTESTLDVAVNANGNPAATEFAIQRTSDSQYLQANGTFGASEDWQTAAEWGTTTATGLSPETTYYFQVKARNGANVETAFGDAGSNTTEASCAPDAPTGLDAVPDYTSFIASWNAADGATGYRLDVSTEEDFQVGGNGELIISEVADPSDVANAKFVELYNGTGAEIDLGSANWYLARQANGTTWANILLTGTIPAGGTYVVAYNQTSFESAFGEAADQYNGNVSGNGDDGYFLIQGGGYGTGTVVDAYGVIDQDGTGYAWEYLDKNAVRNADVATPNSTWTAAEWTIPGTTVNVADMTPGAHVCTGDLLPSFVSGYENLAVAGTSQEVAGLDEGTAYYFRVRAEGEGGCPSANSTTGTVTTLLHLRVEVSRTAVNVREGGEGRFFVRLNKDPEGTIVIATTRSAGDASLAVQSGAALAFGSANWSVWRAVTLAQAGDGNEASEEATFQVSAAGADDHFVAATALDDDVGDNHALASSGASVAGYAATRMDLAIDGTHTERANYGTVCWLNTEPDGTMTLDLQDIIAMSNVRILNWDFSHRTQQYAIESSLDGTSWTALVDASTGEHAGWEDWEVSATARYLRLTGLGNSADMPVLVSEWEVYGTVVPQPEIQLSKSAVNVRENGEGRFWVRLASAPLANFTVGVAWDSGDAGITVQSGATLVFTPSDWNVWKPVTLAAAADENDVGETAQIQMYAAGVPAGVFVAATALDDDIGTNLALASGGATIGGVSALRAAMAIDGIHADRANYACTVYLNVEPDGTMTLDLQSAQDLGRIRVLNWDWIYRTQGYVVESSTDGETWAPLVDASTGEHAGWEDWEVSATARYLRFTGLYNSASKPVIVAELEVYGPPPARRSPASAPGGAAVAESEPISVLTSDGLEDETGWNAVDGDDATAWVGQKAGGGYIVVEYGPALTLSGLEVDVAEGSLAEIEVLTSLDAMDWQPLPEDLEANPVVLNFLWLLFPDDGTEAVPEVIEIRPNP